MSQRKLVAVVALVLLLGGTLALGVVLLDGADSPDSSPDASSESDPLEREDPGDGESSDDESTTAGDETDENSADGESDDGESPAETDVDETASMPVHIEAADRGPVESGELRLWNTTSDELVATHNLSDGHEHTFEGLTPRTTYDLVVNVSFYPDETVTFNPRISDRVNETIGYEFRGADSYVIDWVVEELPSNVDYDDEDAEEKAFTTRGTSKLGPEGNFYIGWNRPGYEDTYDHLWIESHEQAYSDSPSKGTEWKKTERNYTNRVLQRETIVENGLSDIAERKFIGKKESSFKNSEEIHIYMLPNTDALDPMMVHVDPNNGYIIYSEVQIEKLQEPTALESFAQYQSHESSVDPIPNNFPLDKS